MNSKLNECIKIQNSVQEIGKIYENINKYNSQKIEFKFTTENNDDFYHIITKIKEFGIIISEGEKYTFKFKNGVNYIVNKNGLVATKNSEVSNCFNCNILGDKEIPKNRISKWKIKLNEISNPNHICIGIGPENQNNKINFYEDCWTFYCYTSQKVIRSTSPSDYNGKKVQLKKGDIVEVIVDRISGKLSFAVNDLDYGIACSKIPKDDILYPIVLLYNKNESVEIV